MSMPPMLKKTNSTGYELGELYHFRNPVLREGFQPAQGGLLSDAANQYPEIWAYLQTSEGQQLCTTEAEWQAMTRASWGAGTAKGNWNGIGGAPYYVQDLDAGTLRLPDVRGMFVCAAGDGSYAPALGKAMGDMIRNITGSLHISSVCTSGSSVGAELGSGALSGSVLKHTVGITTWGNSGGGSKFVDDFYFYASNVIPVGNANTPRSYGALACVFLGQPSII